MNVLQTKHESLKGSLFGGNAPALETPLAQLESTVDQLMAKYANGVGPEVLRRVVNLKPKIDELAGVSQPEAINVIQAKYESVKKVLVGRNPQAVEAPLSQLESTVEQLLERARPAPLPLDGFDEPEAPPRITPPEQATPLQLDGFDDDPAAANQPTPLPLDGFDEAPIEVEPIDARASGLGDAKAKIADLSIAPFDRSAYDAVAKGVVAQVASQTGELSTLLKTGTENQDQNIHRKILLGPMETSDTGYVARVQQPCDEALKAVDQAIAGNKPISPAFGNRLKFLLRMLDDEEKHYAGRIDDADGKLKEQRQHKVAAIQQRKRAISAAIEKIDGIVKIPEAAEAAARDRAASNSRPTAPTPPSCSSPRICKA